MLRITPSKNAIGASKYFKEGLAREDYYSENKDVQGHWFGKGACRLGLSGEVKKCDFESLVNNRKPGGKEKLTPRDGKNRRAGYDFTFNAVKSVSLVFAITGDEDILRCHRQAVKAALTEVEKNIQTQAGQGKNKHYQTTGNLIGALFDHFTSRPVKTKTVHGDKYIPDPHLHTHCFVMNGTFHQGNDRFQAVEVGTIKKEAHYYQSIYHSRLIKGLKESGYQIERHGKSYEIAGISRELINKFSTRTLQIEEIARQKNEELKKQGKALWEKDKASIGALSRDKKSLGEEDAKLGALWRSRLTQKEFESIILAKRGKERTESDTGRTKKVPEITAQKCVDLAIQHFLERKSVTSEKRVLGKAIEFGYGRHEPEQLKEVLDQRKDLVKLEKNGARLMTTKDMIASESKLVRSASQGKNACAPIAPNHTITNTALNEGQREAVNHVLGSRDKVMVISGAAGTGKTTLWREVHEAHKQCGRPMVACAPSAEAVKSLKENGFIDARTIASLLRDEQVNQSLQGKTLLVDEAGMVSVKDMNGIFDAAQGNVRVMLSGDYRQHTSVDSGDAQRLIEERSGIKTVQVKEIMRQRSDENYRKAIEDLSQGRSLEGFDKLDRIGAIKEISDPDQRHERIAKDYLASIQSGRDGLLVSPTHAEGQAVTRIIREKLRAEQLIGCEDRNYQIRKDLSLTEAEKSHPKSFANGLSVRFHDRVEGFDIGRHYQVSHVSESGKVYLKGKTGQIPLPLDQAKNFGVYQSQQIGVTEGDMIRLNRNSRDVNGMPLINGQVEQIQRFEEDGNIVTKSGLVLHKGYRDFNSGYYSTSHAAQGKTTQDIFIAQSSMSHAASSARQFYVSASRGAERIKIYTDCKSELRDTVAREDERMDALSLQQEKQEQQTIQNMQDRIISEYYQNQINKLRHEKPILEQERGIHGRSGIGMESGRDNDIAR